MPLTLMFVICAVMQIEHGFRLAVKKDTDMTWDTIPENLVVNVRFTAPDVADRLRRRARLAQLSMYAHWWLCSVLCI